MDTFRMDKEDWEKLEPLLVEAEREGHREYFAEHGGEEGTESPGALLLRHLMRRGDAEGLILFRAVEMYFHELSRKGYAAAYMLGKQSGKSKGKAEAG